VSGFRWGRVFTITKIDDEIVWLRAILGVTYGIIAYFIYKFSIILMIDVSVTIWLLAGVIYVASAFYVQYKYGALGLFRLFIRGIVTFYAIWIVVLLLLYDLFG
jgi:hypothetical protein